MESIIETTYTDNETGTVATTNNVLKLLESVVSVDDNQEEKADFVNGVISNFPIDNSFNVIGSTEVIKKFNDIERNKADFILGVQDITNVDFPDDRNINFVPFRPLKFDILDQTGKKSYTKNILTIYDAKKKFLNGFYRLDYFANFAFAQGEKDLILSNLKELNEKPYIQDLKMKFRLIENENQWYLRSVVSDTRYKTFDNATVMFIAFSKINSFSKKSNVSFGIRYANISDSKMELILSEQKSSEIAPGIYLKAGVSVTNSELGDGAVRFTFNYEVHNNNNKKFTVMDAQLAQINHGHRFETISSELNAIDEFSNQRESVVSLLKEINWTKKVTKESRAFKAVYANIALIAGQTISAPIKEQLLSAIDPEEIFKNAVTLIDVMGKLNDAVSKQSRDIQRIIEDRLNSLIPKLK
ncbi:hypothetical protein [Leuconostoc citreum]|uniref:hypothetical protein n=1 Tax=Leuconostoc citreum TaxID=33964 RepID=UPI0032DE6C59